MYSAQPRVGKIAAPQVWVSEVSETGTEIQLPFVLELVLVHDSVKESILGLALERCARSDPHSNMCYEYSYDRRALMTQEALCPVSHWSSTKFVSAWRDTFSVLVARGRA
eukprot:COSAG02_NODE_30786_length_545_cov_1.082960_1_plen_109_part_01